MIARALAIGALTACVACSVDADSNAAQRCGSQAECGAGQLCYAGFCLDDGTTEQQEDPSSLLDAGPSTEGWNDGDGSYDEDEEEPVGLQCTLDVCCLAGLCCESDQLICDGVCVNPEKDSHHCGGCGNVCEHGPCKDGMCREDS
jgi:hypothetical protein